MVEIEGVRIFGSPYTQYYSKGAFQYLVDRDKFVWSNLPDGIDLLVTHSPPYGILDKTKDKSVGSPALRTRVEQIRPRLHIFGHIHESHGRVMIGPTTFINVAKKYEVFEWL
jgi:Icc-related predicted phosphoesterase